MAASTHNRTTSQESALSTISDEITRDFQHNIDLGYSTEVFVMKACDDLEHLAADPNRFLNHSSTFLPPTKIDPHAILKAMLDHAPTDNGKRYVACAIISCVDDTFAKVHLANTWLRYLLLVFKGNSDKRSVTASENATPTLAQTEIDLNSIPSSRQASFRDSVLQRDGYQCLLTDTYDASSMAEDATVPMSDIQAAHILKRAVAVFDDRQRSSAFATWDIIRQYADWPDKTLDDMMELIDTPENGFMLLHDFHRGFDNFIWTLVPEKTPDDKILPHTYRVKILRNVLPLTPFKKVITFANRPPPKILNEVPNAKQFPLPNPKFLALHAALAHVLHMSGAGRVIDLYMDRSTKAGPEVPSGKIRHGDDLAVFFSQLVL